MCMFVFVTVYVCDRERGRRETGRRQRKSWREKEWHWDETINYQYVHRLVENVCLYMCAFGHMEVGGILWYVNECIHDSRLSCVLACIETFCVYVWYPCARLVRQAGSNPGVPIRTVSRAAQCVNIYPHWRANLAPPGAGAGKERGGERSHLTLLWWCNIICLVATQLCDDVSIYPTFIHP